MLFVLFGIFLAAGGMVSGFASERSYELLKMYCKDPRPGNHEQFCDQLRTIRGCQIASTVS